MNICFTLSMPGRASWNGRWSGEETLYAIVQPFKTKKQIAKAQTILAQGSYSYSWTDGWRAEIAVKEVDSQQTRKIRKASKGFCGYDWMVESIITRGKILASHEIQSEVAA